VATASVGGASGRFTGTEAVKKNTAGNEKVEGIVHKIYYGIQLLLKKLLEIF
jgi:hypothetical protein